MALIHLTLLQEISDTGFHHGEAHLRDCAVAGQAYDGWVSCSLMLLPAVLSGALLEEGATQKPSLREPGQRRCVSTSWSFWGLRSEAGHGARTDIP